MNRPAFVAALSLVGIAAVTLTVVALQPAHRSCRAFHHQADTLQIDQHLTGLSPEKLQRANLAYAHLYADDQTGCATPVEKAQARADLEQLTR